MATVRISKELRSDLVHGIRDAGDKEIRALPMVYTTVVAGVDERQMLEKIFWKGHEDLIGRIPPEWLPDLNTLSIHVDIPDRERFNRVGCMIKDLKMVVPPTSDTYSSLAIPWGDCSPLVRETVLAVSDKQNKVHDINKKYSAIEEQLLGFLRTCPSLNAAVKSYPNILFWLPEHYKLRLEEQTTKTKKAAVAPNIALLDQDLITAAAALNLITK